MIALNVVIGTENGTGGGMMIGPDNRDSRDNRDRFDEIGDGNNCHVEMIVVAPRRGAAGSSSSTCGGMTGHDTAVMVEIEKVEISINVITGKVCSCTCW